MSNFARKFLPHRLQDTAINNIMYAVKSPYIWSMQNTNENTNIIYIKILKYSRISTNIKIANGYLNLIIFYLYFFPFQWLKKKLIYRWQTARRV